MIPRQWLRLDPDRVLLEQIRLLLSIVGTVVLPAFVLVGVLVWALDEPEIRIALISWAVAVLGSKLLNWWYALRTLKGELQAQGAPTVVGWLMLLNAVDGLAWGFLPWVALDTASVAETVLVIAVMAGVSTNAMSALSALPRVFIAFGLVMMSAVVSKLLHMGDPAYQTLAAVVVLYVGALIAQSRVNAATTRSLFTLRFENVEIVERLEQETARAKDAEQRATEANVAKSKFLAAASHDLRQPIHAQGLFLEVLGMGDLSPAQRSMLDNARASVTASAEMLNALLDFSRIEAGVLQPQVRPSRLQPLLGKMETDFADQAAAKGLVFRTRETDAVVDTDPILLELILRNLVSNAVRYTRQGGCLLACRKRSDHVWLEVWDTGIGIDATSHEEIFREFHQLGNPERDRNKGLGLGLAVVDGLVRRLGHVIRLRSVPGRGTVFRLKLPVASGPELPDDTVTELPQALTLQARVLVIEDDETVRMGMQQLLVQWGCECLVADSLDEALAVTRGQSPDIVISDFRLREQRSGTDAIAALRAEFGQALPALLITGDTAPERLLQAQLSGIPLLHKPVVPTLLHRKLVDGLRTREGQTEAQPG